MQLVLGWTQVDSCPPGACSQEVVSGAVQGDWDPEANGGRFIILCPGAKIMT